MATINGDGSDNILTGGPADDLIRGRGGDDLVDGGDGDDRLKGNNGEDTLIDGAGNDRMWGGSGADIFKLVADGDKDRILDWENGTDTIDLSDWGVTDIADLTFQSLNNGQMRITFGNEILQIKQAGGAALSLADFDAADFVFAQPQPTPIDFETLDTGNSYYGAPIEFIDPGHAGLAWSDYFYFAEEDDLAAANLTSGHLNRTGGGNVFAMNGFGADVHFSAADNFDFEQVEIGALYRDGMTVRIVGMDDGQFVGQQLVTVDTTGSQTVALDDQIFDSVDQVVLQSYGGTDNPAWQIAGDNTHFYIDDLVIV